MSTSKHVGRPKSDERLRVDGWLPPHLTISPEVDALALVRLWRCYSVLGRYHESREVLARLRSLAERPAGKPKRRR